MRTLSCLFFLCFSLVSIDAAASSAPPILSDDFTVTKIAYWFSSDFDCRTEDQRGTKVSRSGFFNYYYDYYDERNDYLARGITRTFSFTTVIDIYDHYGTKIGMIEGQLWTNARRKYVIYDEHNNQKGVAYLHDKQSSFVVVSPINDKVVLAKLKQNSFGDVHYWDVKFPNGSSFDDRVIKIFGAFVSDYEIFFKEPVKEIHHHHYSNRPNQQGGHNYYRPNRDFFDPYE